MVGLAVYLGAVTFPLEAICEAPGTFLRMKAAEFRAEVARNAPLLKVLQGYTQAVLEIRAQVDIPIIGMGGIMTAEDALEFLMAGASAISIGAVNMIDPRISTEILEGIESWCTSHGISSISEIIGCAH